MNNRRRIVGVVTSNKMQKSVVVEISRSFRHPLYKKVVHTSRHIMAHDELGCQMGDKVRVVESQPLSHSKRWVVEEILVKEGKQLRIEDTVAAVVEEQKPETTEAAETEAVAESAEGEVK